jgi:flagellar basal body-associated protein FliL
MTAELNRRETTRVQNAAGKFIFVFLVVVVVVVVVVAAIVVLFPAFLLLD